ncbi:MAG: hypothetical protein ABS68_11130 [Niastella sp. SCN 39-18]|mgnify:FL=1|nr:amidohydrolase family protein [Sphingobacteriales bacterium]ODT51929.1 MAG: hypothetical protein ABS68_11130 [Niastella sp. SCN 39-18]OJW11525.1 MAG: hypothetical protein BGO53_11350 [Sphingobacteriales bacterium 39-19]
MFRKFKADRIFNGDNFAPPHSVLITTAAGEIIDLLPEAVAGTDIEVLQGTLCPGFVNVHCHIELSHMLNKIPMHTGLVDFVKGVMQKRAATTQQKGEAMAAAEKQLRESGTVAIGDICNTPDSIPLKRNSQLYWKNFIEITGFADAVAKKRMVDMQPVKSAFEESGLPATFVPHAPYSVSKTLLGEIDAVTKNEIISIHNQETGAENELFRSGTGAFIQFYHEMGIDISHFIPAGKSSFCSWLPFFNHQQTIIAVHNTFTSLQDIQGLTAAQKEKIFFCICPNANLFIENTLPPIEMFLSENMQLVIGTDSLASNHTLNMYEEIKTLQKYFPGIEEEYILRWATSGGASALGLSDQLGSFEKKKFPGLVILHNGESKRVI